MIWAVLLFFVGFLVFAGMRTGNIQYHTLSLGANLAILAVVGLLMLLY